MLETKASPILADLLAVLLANKGSDLHLQSGEVPIGRINGELGRFEMPPLTENDVLRLGPGRRPPGHPGHSQRPAPGGGAGEVPALPAIRPIVNL